MNSCRSPAFAPGLAILACLAAAPAAAERADRDKPVHLEANRITVDEAKKVQVLEGNVHLVQGTIVIRAEKILVSQDGAGFQKGTAYAAPGRLATFRQKREGRDEYIDGEAERIEYDSKAEKVELFDKAHIKSGLNEVRGQYITYDGKTENYLVTGNVPDGGTGKSARPERVMAVIQPKSREPQTAAPAPAAKPAR